jgi:sigma-B regulation protein RsbU (phosphoserine phosphatase)
MKRRLAVTLFSLTLFALTSWAIATRVIAQHRAGWVGMMYYNGNLPKEAEMMRGIIPPNGSVTSVLTGTPAWRAGIAGRDRIISVNGIPVREMERIQQLAERVRRGDVITYQIEHRGKLRTVRLQTVSPLSLTTVVIGMLFTIAVAGTYLAISILVLWARPRQRAAWVFFWLSTLGSLSFALSVLLDFDVMMHAGIEPAMSRMETITLYIGIACVSLLVSTLIFHLALIFPKNLPVVQRHPLIIRWLYCLALLPIVLPPLIFTTMTTAKTWRIPVAVAAGVVAIVLAVRWFRVRAREGTRNAVLDHPWITLAPLVVSMLSVLTVLRATAPRPVLFFIAMLVGGIWVLGIIGVAGIYSLLTLFALYRGYVRSSREEKRQVRWPLWGTATAIGSSLAITILLVGLTSMHEAPEPLLVAALASAARVAFILIPLSFAFAILKYRLMDIDVILKKTVVYSFVTGIIVGAFFALVAGLGTLMTTWLKVQSQTVTVISTLLLAGLFVPVRNRVQHFVDRRFFRRKFDLSEAEKLIHDEVMSATELQPLLRRVVEWIQHALQVRSVVILVPRTDSEDVLEAVATIGVPDELVRMLSIDRDTVGRAEGVVPIGNLRLQQDDWTRIRRIHGELAVPMLLRGRLEGLMLVGSRLSGTFEEEDREFLASVTRELALGIDNLTVSDEARDFEQALQVQRALLPRSMPRIGGVDIDATWKPARIVGGDYFDVFTVGPSTLALCIGDVAGKGMPAALLMASLQAAVKASASRDAAPSDVCSRISSIVTSTLQGGRFVTFFYALLDTSDMRLRYTNAGHNPPLLIRASGEVVRLAAGGPVFARLMQGAAYVTSDEVLASGDTLVLFTDGVTEARSPEEEEFGEQRLIDVVRSAQPGAAHVVRDIVEQVRQFSHDVAHDDVTIVVVRV